jgi:hypothetical protein
VNGRAGSALQQGMRMAVPSRTIKLTLNSGRSRPREAHQNWERTDCKHDHSFDHSF